MTGGNFQRRPEALRESRDNLLNVGDLFVRGKNEGSQAFPGGLLEEAKASVGPLRLTEVRIHGEAPSDVVEVETDLKIVLDSFPVGTGMGGGHVQRGALLGDLNPVVVNDPDRGVIPSCPAERLSAGQGTG